jgi:hypothetical protein
VWNVLGMLNVFQALGDKSLGGEMGSGTAREHTHTHIHVFVPLQSSIVAELEGQLESKVQQLLALQEELDALRAHAQVHVGRVEAEVAAEQRERTR